MNVAPRYLGRGSWLSRRDPRVLVLALAMYVFAVIQVWDIRILAVMAAIAFTYYRSAGIPFRSVRLNWGYVLFFVSFVVLANTLITGGELRGARLEELHIYFRLPLLNTPISAESVTYALAQLLRFFSMAAMGFPLAFAIAPGDIGPAFARLGIPDKFAYARRDDVPVHPEPRRRRADHHRRPAHPRLRLGACRTGPCRQADPHRPDHGPGDDQCDRRCGGHDRRDGPARIRDRAPHPGCAG